jgi:anti-anti-sigma regulatory factor
MTVSPISNLATLSGRGLQSIAIDYDLVRENEERVDLELLPQVRQSSVALDLSQVERIDAAGIASLIALYCTAIESGNLFYVVDPSIRVLELLRLVGLETILVLESPIPGSAVPRSDLSAGTTSAPLQFTRSAA